jgi:beta-mannosidase
VSYRPLHDGWTVSAVPPDLAITAIPARVPGCVHTDLLSAGLIDDPYLDDNETRLTWIGRTDWVYRTSFSWTDSDHERADLVCDGLDTIATITLNGATVASTANMHRGYRFDVRTLLVEGDNSLEIYFHSPYGYAEGQRDRLGKRPGPYAEPYQFIRKMACNFGWDWGPTLVTSGIWQRIGLHEWSGARLAEVRPLVAVSEKDGQVEVPFRVERSGAEDIVVTAEIAGVTASVTLAEGAAEGVLRLAVPKPALWWPRGYGAQPLYELTVRAGDDSWSRSVGFRTVGLETDAFRIAINSQPVFVKGFNWIPDDCFPHRVTKEDLAERFQQAIDAGANTLRVWGGGLYESRDFYELADRLGLLIWQDFPFACAAYPEDEPFASEVEAEARENVIRLMAHPSLVLWCGNNENIEGYQHWGWPAELEGRTWGAEFYYNLLPAVVSELDPLRPYWPGTPYSGEPDRDVKDPATGTVHIWTVWGGALDYTHYSAYTPRFVAEFGYQGPPAYATLRAAVSDEPLTPTSPGVMHHQKALDGNNKLLNGLGDHLPQPESFDDWHYFTQLNQARAMSFGLQRFRALMPYCMGTIIWQLNDCWPVTSWAAIDGAARRKPLWYAVREAYADRLVSFQDGEVALVNDSPESWSGELVLTRRSVTGEILAKETVNATIAPRDVTRIPLTATLLTPAEASRELLVAELGSLRAIRMFAEDPVMQYPPALFDAETEPAPGGLTLRITARSMLRELAVFPDRLDPAATVDQQLLTLLPGETATLRVSSDQDLDPARLLAFPVFRCVNEVQPDSLLMKGTA